jgi:hypothetical protein
MNASGTSTLRIASTTALFCGGLVAFLVLALGAMLVTAFSNRLSLFFFDLPDHVFPIACPDGMGNAVCRVWAHGWNANWAYLVWGLVAITFGFLARGRPLRQKIILAFITIAAVTLAMQIGMDFAGYYAFVDWM